MIEKSFSFPQNGFEQAQAWSRRGARTSQTGKPMPAMRVWIVVGLLPLLLFVLRRRRVVAVIGAGVWCIGAVAVSAQPQVAHVNSDRALVLPFGDRALSFGTVELTLSRRGAVVLPTGQGEVSVEDAYPNGACLIRSGRKAVWVLAGQPGDQLRLTYLKTGPRGVVNGSSLDPISDWPRGPLQGRPVRGVDGTAGPFSQPAAMQQIGQVEGNSATASEPLYLKTPAQPEN